MMTTRDMSIINFVEEFKVANTSTIAEVFFDSRYSCYKRLQIINKSRELKRYRDSINNEFIYFKKKPKQLKHSLMISHFYRELHKKSDIVNFKIEPVMGDIRPDALFGYKCGDKSYLGLLEVEISHKGFNYNKYDRFYSSGNYKNFLPVMPTVFIVGDKINLPDKSKIKYIVIDTEFNEFRLE